MRTLGCIFVVIVGIGALIYGGLALYFSPPADPVYASGEPIVTIVPTATTSALAITPQPTVGPVAHGDPQRMQFAIGTYGGSYQAGTWILWAARGQTLTLGADALVNAKLTAPSGDGVLLEGNKATLPASGDYLLTVDGVESFTIDIR